MKHAKIVEQAQWLVDRGIVDPKWKNLVVECFTDNNYDSVVKELRSYGTFLAEEGYFRRFEDIRDFLVGIGEEGEE